RQKSRCASAARRPRSEGCRRPTGRARLTRPHLASGLERSVYQIGDLEVGLCLLCHSQGPSLLPSLNMLTEIINKPRKSSRKKHILREGISRCLPHTFKIVENGSKFPSLNNWLIYNRTSLQLGTRDAYPYRDYWLT